MDAPFQLRCANEYVCVRPLVESDFDALFAVGSDPLIWEQHPISDRYTLGQFQRYFDGALASAGALLFLDAQSQAVIGCSRFYDFDPPESLVHIGYTFFARSHWGGPYNRVTKTLMLDHAFQYVDKVHFHVGKTNVRSQKAIQKLGVTCIDERQVSYQSGQTALNLIYQITCPEWFVFREK